MSLARCAVLAISALVLACAPTEPSAPAAVSSPPPVSGAPVRGSDPLEGPGATPATVTADDLSMTVRVVTPTVAVGGVVDIAVTIQNDRPTPVDHMVQCDAPVTATARLPVPQEPEGIVWGGIGGEFKAYALRLGTGPGGAPALDPMTVHAPAFPCQGLDGAGSLEAGGSLGLVLSMPANLVEGVPAAPGPYRAKVEFLHDPGDGGSGIVSYQQLALDVDFTVEGPVPRIVSAGEAVDAMLAEPRFAEWLPQMPSTTWSVANLFLEHGDGQGDVVPKGASWSIELFREIGVPRNWAIGHVDPFSGALLTLTFCNDPCDR